MNTRIQMHSVLSGRGHLHGRALTGTDFAMSKQVSFTYNTLTWPGLLEVTPWISK